MKKSYQEFLEQLSKDSTLREKLTSIDITDEIKAKQTILDIAKENGYDLSMEDLQIQIADTADEVSDDEMHAISGGLRDWEEANVGCMCPIVGGGGGHDMIDNNKYGCACVLYGQGGDGRANDFNCVCMSGGAGFDDGPLVV